MGTYTDAPNGDDYNDGWGLVGSGVTAAWIALSALGDDTKYVSSPAYQGHATVTFPTDISSLPDGAIVTSVTIRIRTGTGAGTPPAGTPSAVTVTVTCADDRSRYTTRTVYPTSTITTVDVGTYKVDPLGLSWDVERLNQLLVGLHSYTGVADTGRVYEAYAVVNYRVRPTLTITAPTGAVSTPSPTLSWVYTQTDGDPQASADYRVFTDVQQRQVEFDPQATTPVFAATVSGAVNKVTKLPTALTPNNYWVFVRATSTFGAATLWQSRPFTVAGPAPGKPGVDDPNGGSSAVISVVPDVVSGAATLTLGDTSNLMSVMDADAEVTGRDGTTLTGVNTTPARDSATFFPGGKGSWNMTSVASGDMKLVSDWTEIAPAAQTITVSAQFLTATSARNVSVSLAFYDSTFTSVGSAIVGAAVSDSATTWTLARATGTTPTGAVFCRATFTVASTGGAAEVHWVDRLGIMYGTNTAWSDGGHMSRNLLSAWYSNAEGTPLAGEAWTPGIANTVSTATPPGTGGSGSTCNTMTYAGFTPTLALRAAGTAYTATTAGVAYTLNKPAGVTTGDLMLAFVSSSEFGTITPPAGWAAVNVAAVDDGSTDTALFVLKRTAGASEPSTWTDGTLSASAVRRHAVVVAYSGAADASTQFLADGATATANNLPVWLSTPVLTNTDPNAWRVSAFAVNDNATGGTLTANTYAPGVIPPISYVGQGAVFNNTHSSTTYTLYRPTGVQTGDLMLGFVSCSGSVTVNTPTGWTLVRRTAITSGSTSETLAVFKRTAGASEPSSWASTITGTPGPSKTTSVQAYRNCADASVQFIAEGGATRPNAQSIATANVTNTNSMGWRVCAFGADSAFAFGWTSSEVAQRHDDSASTGNVPVGQVRDVNALAVFDSNGPVSTGSYFETGTLAQPFVAAVSWIGIIKPLSAPPSSVPNETSRSVTMVGASNPWLTTGVFDSNGVIPVGSTSVTGIWAPGSGSDWNSAAAWAGIIAPASPLRSGYAYATMATTVDVSHIDPTIPALGGNQVTVTASFIGSVAGTPYLACNFFRANTLLGSSIAQGTPFDAATWSKSAATFDVPVGTTRMSVELAAADCNIADVVYFDRVGLSYGPDSVWRPGTSRDEHPVWSRPQIEYADGDGTGGYTPWQPLPGQAANPVAFDALSGMAVFPDHTVVPLTNRKYRATTISYGLLGDLFVSATGPESSAFSFTAENWWLKDISNPSNNLQLKVKWDDYTFTLTNSSTVFQPLGDEPPFVLSQGYKTDRFDITIWPTNQDDWAQLKLLLKAGRTLFLQSDFDQGWWVRSLGDLPTTVIANAARQSNPLRAVKVSFVQVAPEL